MHGLYVGNAAHPRMTGSPEFLKGQVKHLTPAERAEGWTIGPVRMIPWSDNRSDRKPSTIWVLFGIGVITAFGWIVVNCFSR